MKRFLLLLIFLQATIALGVDINGPLVRAGLENKSSDPSTTLTGRVYWNTANKKARIWDGSAWGDFGTGGGASAAYTVSPTAVTAVGTAGMPQAGHTLDSNDFPVTTGKIAFWNFAASSTADSSTALMCTAGTAACTLTVVGTAPAAATGIDGTTSAFSINGGYWKSSDAKFAPGNGKSWAVGAWVKMADWTPASSQVIFANMSGGSDRVFEIYQHVTLGTQFTATNSAASTDAAMSVTQTSAFADGSWHHIVEVFDYTSSLLKAYVDGKLISSVTLANTRAATTPWFSIGSETGSFLANATFDEAFFVSDGRLTDDDVRKIYSRRFDHNLAISPESQLWLVNAARSDNYVTNQDTSGALVSKDNNRVWFDFSGFATGSYVSAKMLNTQSSLTSVPQGSYDSGYLSSTPITTIPHGLGDVPAAVVVYYETTTNRFTPLMGSNFCETDATNLYCDWTGLTVAAASRVRIQAWSTGSMSAITAASASQSGIVNTTQQSMSGLKQFLGGTSIIGNIRASEGAGTTTLTDADNRVQVFNLSAARTVVLPTTSIKAGDIWVLESRGAFDLTVQASNLSALTTANLVNIDATIQSGTVRLVALQDTPTTPAHWRVLDLTEEQSFSKTTVGALTGAAVTGRLVRNNKNVTMTISGTSGTCSSSTYIGLTNVFPTRFQIGGSFNPYFPIYVQNAGAYQTTTGFIYFNGAADFQVYKDNTSAAGLFSSSGTCGWQGVSISWTTP